MALSRERLDQIESNERLINGMELKKLIFRAILKVTPFWQIVKTYRVKRCIDSCQETIDRATMNKLQCTDTAQPRPLPVPDPDAVIGIDICW